MKDHTKGIIAGALFDLIVDDLDLDFSKTEKKSWNKGAALKAIASIKKDALDCLFSSDSYKRAENLTDIALKVEDDEVRAAAVEALTEIRDKSIYSVDRHKINALILKLVIE